MFRHSHDENHCSFDLWAPNKHTKINNVAFSAYAKHEQEKEDIIQTILEVAYNGETSFSIDLDDYFDENDLMYIKEEVYRRLR